MIKIKVKDLKSYIKAQEILFGLGFYWNKYQDLETIEVIKQYPKNLKSIYVNRDKEISHCFENNEKSDVSPYKFYEEYKQFFNNQYKSYRNEIKNQLMVGYRWIKLNELESLLYNVTLYSTEYFKILNDIKIHIKGVSFNMYIKSLNFKIWNLI